MIPCLSIAGFDGSGGAGIQADLKTLTALGCYGMTVLTALPVQNTCGVKAIHEIPVACIQQQLEAIFEDIPPKAIKIGMLYSQTIIEAVADFLEEHARHTPIILDPVIVSTQGNTLLQPNAIATLKQRLIPRASLITPNIPEAMCLTEKTEKEALLQDLLRLGCDAVLLTGGHEESTIAKDYFIDQTGARRDFCSKRIATQNTHGTGCTLSAAITAYVAQGDELMEACQKAKNYLTGALLSAQHNSLGKGNGPVNHCFKLDI